MNLLQAFLTLMTAYSLAALGQLFFFHVVLIRKVLFWTKGALFVMTSIFYIILDEVERVDTHPRKKKKKNLECKVGWRWGKMIFMALLFSDKPSHWLPWVSSNRVSRAWMLMLFIAEDVPTATTMLLILGHVYGLLAIYIWDRDLRFARLNNIRLLIHGWILCASQISFEFY